MENPKYMLSRDGKIRGEIRNMHSRKCAAEGCPGHRIHVVWPDGKKTFPCSRGCKTVNVDTLQIL